MATHLGLLGAPLMRVSLAISCMCMCESALRCTVPRGLQLQPFRMRMGQRKWLSISVTRRRKWKTGRKNEKEKKKKYRDEKE